MRFIGETLAAFHCINERQATHAQIRTSVFAVSVVPADSREVRTKSNRNGDLLSGLCRNALGDAV